VRSESKNISKSYQADADGKTSDLSSSYPEEEANPTHATHIRGNDEGRTEGEAAGEGPAKA
jgi:hypothetical protein